VRFSTGAACKGKQDHVLSSKCGGILIIAYLNERVTPCKLFINTYLRMFGVHTVYTGPKEYIFIIGVRPLMLEHILVIKGIINYRRATVYVGTYAFVLVIKGIKGNINYRRLTIM